MNSMRAVIKQRKPHLVTFACVSHTLHIHNLLSEAGWRLLRLVSTTPKP